MSKEELSWEERRDIAQKTMDKREFDGYQREDGHWVGFGNITPFVDWAIHNWLDIRNIPRLRSELTEEQINLLKPKTKVIPRRQDFYRKVNFDCQYVVDLIKEYPNETELGKEIIKYYNSLDTPTNIWNIKKQR